MLKLLDEILYRAVREAHETSLKFPIGGDDYERAIEVIIELQRLRQALNLLAAWEGDQ